MLGFFEVYQEVVVGKYIFVWKSQKYSNVLKEEKVSCCCCWPSITITSAAFSLQKKEVKLRRVNFTMDFSSRRSDYIICSIELLNKNETNFFDQNITSYVYVLHWCFCDSDVLSGTVQLSVSTTLFQK